MPRGPKPKTLKNSRSKPTLGRAIDYPEPASVIGPEAHLEFYRLCAVLDQRGQLDRVDVSVITECARITILLNRCHALQDVMIDPKNIILVTQLTSQRAAYSANWG